MSRVFDALQKSQGDNPSASPLAQGQPESAPGELHHGAAAAANPPSAPGDVPSAIAGNSYDGLEWLFHGHADGWRSG